MIFVNCNRLSNEINGYSESLIIDVVEAFKLKYHSFPYLYPNFKEAERDIKNYYHYMKHSSDKNVVIYNELYDEYNYIEPHYKCVLFFISYNELKKLFIKFKKMRVFA